MTTLLPQTLLRPLREADIAATDEMSWAALAEVGRRFGFAMGTRDAARIAWARARIRHLATTDPDGCVVAERDGQIVGVGLSLRRGPLWFLSLFAVRNGEQGGGIGRQVLDATLEYSRGCRTAMICASPDPKALRRYGQAGFDLHPAYEAVGVPDRTEIPRDLGVRDGDWARHTDLVEELITQRRGAPYGPDLAWCRDHDVRLFVRDGADRSDRAVALTSGAGRIGLLAAASTAAATRMLWSVLAEAPGEVTVGWVTARQQWAVQVALAARLRLQLTDTVCTRGLDGPPALYLPFGVFG
jgi:GNAT superfamily N-acetyltransferase